MCRQDQLWFGHKGAVTGIKLLSGGEEKARGQIALCASSLTFVHPKTKKQMQFEIQPQAAGFDLFFASKI